MKVKLLRNLGTGLVKELGLKWDDKYEADTVHDVDNEVSDKLIKQGLAETTKDELTKKVQAVPPVAPIRGITERHDLPGSK